MKAALLAVGDELFQPGRMETNTVWLQERLDRAGVEVVLRGVVGDHVERIARHVRWALGLVDLVVITGGLGPTEDDRTREGLALALGTGSERDAEELGRLREYLVGRGIPYVENHARQADRPVGSTWIDNPVGSARGLLFRGDAFIVVALPGVPSEMKAMFDASVPAVLSGVSNDRRGSRILHIVGPGESSADALLSDLYGAPGLEATILSGTGGLQLLFRVRGEGVEDVDRRLDELEAEVRRRLGDDVFGVDDTSLPRVVGQLLLEAGATLATAESCSSGLLAAAATSVPGSSAWYRGGLVVYHSDLKRCLAGVEAATLAAHGEVSESVALELAAGARRRCEATIGVGITGIAGPGGGTPDKPVGLVHMAIDDDRGTEHRRWRLPGDRDDVRARSVTLALDRIRRRLLERRRQG